MKRFKFLIVLAVCISLIMSDFTWAGEITAGTAEETEEEVTESVPESEPESMDVEGIWESQVPDVDETEETDESETDFAKQSVETEESEEAGDVLTGFITDSDGKLFYYENGQKFTGGYKEIIDNETGNVDYYFFQDDGSAYTAGYKPVMIDGKTYYFYFQKDGKAFTGGFLEFVHTNGKTYYFYFQSNGRAYTQGYKPINSRSYTDGESDIVKIEDDNTYYYYFRPNGHAYTGGFLEFVHTNGKTYYFYFQSNGQAYTAGYKAVKKRYYADGENDVIKIDDDNTYYYYFRPNGHAYTGGFLEFVHTNGKTYYFYFQSNGQAYTAGYKAVKKRYYADGENDVVKIDDDNTYYYYFQDNGHGYTGGILKFEHTNGKTYIFYFQSNGQAFTDGWKTSRSQKYYFQSNGHGYTGMKTIDDKTYYFNSDGQLQKGWVKSQGHWYYFDESTGVKKFESDVMHTAWSKIKNTSSQTNYFIVVDSNSTRTMIFKGSKGNWIPVYDWICSTGKPSTPTVKGTFTVGAKGYSFGSGYTCYYYTQFYGDYLFHSVLYYEGTKKIMDGTLGEQVSHGCVRLDINNAKWIYDNIPRGTKVYVY
ncbi:MAG: L,D-transpeptidase family protein [Coprococcus sp.]